MQKNKGNRKTRLYKEHNKIKGNHINHIGNIYIVKDIIKLKQKGKIREIMVLKKQNIIIALEREDTINIIFETG